MLCKPGDLSKINKADFVFEPKYDGIRVIATITSDAVKLHSRTGKDLTDSFPDVVYKLSMSRVKDMFPSLVLDGEIVVLDNNDVPNFQRLQQRTMRQHSVTESAIAHPATFIAFDILQVNGYSLTDKTWQQRRTTLMEYYALAGVSLTENAPVTLNLINPSYLSRWQPFRLSLLVDPEDFDKLVAKGYEGLVAKSKLSLYYPGARSADWLKIKPVQNTEAFIGGYTWGYGRRAGTFGAILLGQHDSEGRLTFIGACGTGFTDEELSLVKAKLAALETQESPFHDWPNTEPEAADVLLYARPELKCKVAYQERTQAGILRFPAYKGLVIDEAKSRLASTA